MQEFTFFLPRLILCEGPHDAGFFRGLISQRQLKEFHIKSPDKETGPGISGFKRSLEGFPAITGFEKVKDIVVVADNDDDPATAFADVCKQITDAGLVPPNQPGAVSVGNPNIHVMMIPAANQSGSLESLCYSAGTRGKAAIASCISAFEACLGIAGWPEQKKAKMRLRSYLAGTYRRNPDILFSRVWIEQPNLIPLQDAVFDPIAAYLDTIP
ncbi:DUF3226 domain-containing protein [Rhizobium viscosum]|uniref:DUF4276 family protein n=1 Tax=Rhizobium viscosum TaxID=1673 RepID=A0ABR9IS90_RHIVS|nr:DUF3226 domain-containing protein [Rhizobium viscosum]MBE1506067.1 hypothetical protein [Rhizobium viscosum]